MMKIAVVIIAYNRIDSIKRLINSLLNAKYNDKVNLIISIDKSNTDVVEKYAEVVSWPFGIKKVISHESNLGLRKHVLSIGEHLEEYDSLIVLEDDIIVSPYYFLYAKSAIEQYFDCDDIAGISLYNFSVNYQNHLPFYPLKNEYDVYLMQCAQSWGQIWMKNQWYAFKRWYEKNNGEFSPQPHLPSKICNWPKSSWLKYHTKYCIENNKYFVYPYQAYSSNCGDAGTHASFSNITYQTCFNVGEWMLPKFPMIDVAIKYDAFFENQSLSDLLEIDERNLCIDLYGTKNNVGRKRYWLTTKVLGYQIVRSFGLTYKPIELNVIYKSKGAEIFLYDTFKSVKNENLPLARKKYNYYHGWDIIDNIRFIISYGIINCITLLISLCVKKIKNIR